jgi:hypothetical protein
VTLVAGLKPSTPVQEEPAPAPVAAQPPVVATPAEKPQQLALPPYPGHGAPAAPEPAASKPAEKPSPEPKPAEPQVVSKPAEEPRPRPVAQPKATPAQPQKKAPAVDDEDVQLPKPKRTGLFVGLAVAAIAVGAAVVFSHGSGSDQPTPPPQETKPAPTEQVKAPEPENKAPEAKAPETKPPENKPPETPPAQPEQPASATGTPEAPKPTEQPAVATTGTPPAEDDEKDDEPEQVEAQKLSPEAQYAELARRAKKLMSANRYKTAAITYRKALALKPDSAEAKAGLGISLVRGDTTSSAGYRDASKLLEEVVKAQPRNAQAWVHLGMARQFTNQEKKAIDAYKQYLLLEPSGSSASEVRAALKQLGQ